jgi:exodeoxyribonuclease V alpha subunit
VLRPDQNFISQISRRFGSDSGIGHLAHAINNNNKMKILDILPNKYYQDIEAYELSEAHYKKLLDQVATEYEAYLLAAKNLDYQQAFIKFMDIRLLCALREGLFGVFGLNQQIERRLENRHIIDRKGEWYEGRPIIVTRNDHILQLYNGDIGITMKDEHARLRVYFEASDGIRSVLPSRIPEHETAYAMTVHKSQGSEFTHTVLILPDKINPVVTRELVYTGVTRAKKYLSLLYNADVLSAAVTKRVVRFSGLSNLL